MASPENYRLDKKEKKKIYRENLYHIKYVYLLLTVYHPMNRYKYLNIVFGK